MYRFTMMPGGSRIGIGGFFADDWQKLHNFCNVCGVFQGRNYDPLNNLSNGVEYFVVPIIVLFHSRPKKNKSRIPT